MLGCGCKMIMRRVCPSHKTNGYTCMRRMAVPSEGYAGSPPVRRSVHAPNPSHPYAKPKTSHKTSTFALVCSESIMAIYITHATELLRCISFTSAITHTAHISRCIPNQIYSRHMPARITTKRRRKVERLDVTQERK